MESGVVFLFILHKNYAHNPPTFSRTLESLVQLTEKDLDEMGIGLLGPKRKLTNFIREMREKREQHRKVSTVGNSPPIATVGCLKKYFEIIFPCLI
jgi:hypothetical protein